MEHKEYIPVDCGFYDLIESQAVKRNTVEIEYRSDENKARHLRDIVKTIEADDHHAEFLITGNGDKVRLDHIISFNGQPGPASKENGLPEIDL